MKSDNNNNLKRKDNSNKDNNKEENKKEDEKSKDLNLETHDWNNKYNKLESKDSSKIMKMKNH